jgi:Skp family chaperone for outer membrane proteins
MSRRKSSLLAVVMAFAVAAAWSGMGMAADITPENVGTMAENAKTAQDYEALGNYYDAQGKAAEAKAEEYKAQYDAIHKAKGKRTGPDTSVIATQETFMKHSSEHYTREAKQDKKMAEMYHKLGKAGGGQ